MLLSTSDWVGFWVMGSLLALCVVTLTFITIRAIVNHCAGKESTSEVPVVTAIISLVVGCLLALGMVPLVFYGITNRAIADDLANAGWNVTQIVSNSQVVVLENGKSELVGVAQALMSDGTIQWTLTRTCYINPADFNCFPPPGAS